MALVECAVNLARHHAAGSGHHWRAIAERSCALGDRVVGGNLVDSTTTGGGRRNSGDCPPGAGAVGLFGHWQEPLAKLHAGGGLKQRVGLRVAEANLRVGVRAVGVVEWHRGKGYKPRPAALGKRTVHKPINIFNNPREGTRLRVAVGVGLRDGYFYLCFKRCAKEG